MGAPEGDLWSFATHVYAEQRVRSLCLRLQEDCGVDVVVCLVCAWCAARWRMAVDEDGAVHLLTAVEPLRRWTTSIRALRREVKSARSRDGENDLEQLYAQLLAAELASERAQMDVFARRLSEVAPRVRGEASAQDLALASLRRFAALEGWGAQSSAYVELLEAIFAAWTAEGA